MDYIKKLELLREYINYFVDTGATIILQHKFHTYPKIARDYFVEKFTASGWEITESQLIFRRKSFDEWLLNHTRG